MFITEGSRSEPLFLKNLWKIYRRDNVEIYSYETNIHVLIGELFGGNQFDDGIDLLRHLLSKENDPEEKEKLQRKFTDIFLIFDIDMHDDRADIGLLETMLRAYNDSADEGKLYINYPMLESYRHLRSIDDVEFRDRHVVISQLPRYKNIVEKECCKELKNVNKYDITTFQALVHAHLKKANYILNGEFELPT